MAKRALAADLREYLSSYNDDLWTQDTEGIDSIDRAELVLVETLLTGQGSAPRRRSNCMVILRMRVRMNTMDSILGAITCLQGCHKVALKNSYFNSWSVTA